MKVKVMKVMKKKKIIYMIKIIRKIKEKNN